VLDSKDGHDETRKRLMRGRSFIRRSSLVEAQTTPIDGNGKDRSFSGSM
jgi:hypothetical protein